MYGLVNRAVRDLVVSLTNVVTWAEICDDAGLKTTEFNAMETYDDEVTYKLVGVISRKLNLSSDEVLRAFGRHWILYTAKEGYGDIMSMFGPNFETCLRNLNNMHSRMGAMMPHLVPPRFTVTSADGAGIIRVEYFSKRAGLAPMVVGILEGLAERFSIRVSVTQVQSATTDLPDIFEVQKAA